MSNGRQNIVEELHKPARRNYPRIPVITKGIHDLWQIDLVEMDSGNLKGLSKVNRGYKFLMTIIDTFSKWAWAVPVKNKTGKEITEAFRTVLQKAKQAPKHLQSDRGREFYNSHFKQLMKEYHINHYSTYSDVKASIIERFNRSLRNIMWKTFTLNGNYKWVDILPRLLRTYNSTVHRTIKMKPIDAIKKENEAYLINNVYCKKFSLPSQIKTKFKEDDYVRTSKFKNKFDRGFTRNWSTEIFQIAKVFPTNPATFLLKDANNELIKGRFYEQEIMKTKYPHTYLIEKVLRKKNNKAYVKWLGFPSSHNSWVNLSSVI